VEKYDTARHLRDDNIIWRMRISCLITKATNTHSDYETFIVFPLQQWLHERASVRKLPLLSSFKNTRRHNIPQFKLTLAVLGVKDVVQFLHSLKIFRYYFCAECKFNVGLRENN
jgi:hypothetical protein